ncbi:Serine/threonine-protein kinase WNK1 [Taenia crassiceps]|uniref:Serine/threonine-protein kinase WNK1 n=1 Tax=Taenia crassiceps TaxID=6207 RepID=A0ABR4QJD7_9CEST
MDPVVNPHCRSIMSAERGESIQPSCMPVNLRAEEHIDKKSDSPLNQIPSLNRTADYDLSDISKPEIVIGPAKNTVIADSKASSNEVDDREYPTTPTGTTALGSNEADSHVNAPTANATAAPLDPTAAAALTLKMKEERKKEREKRKEEELMKKYMAEQEAKQKVIGISKCGRWLKNSIKIGEGGYKFVYRGYDREEARTVAWCEFKHEHVDTKEKRQIMFRETEIMLKMNHPHIVRCFDVFREWRNEETAENPLEEKGLVIIQELMSEGTLRQVIRKNYLDGQCILKFQLLTHWWHQIVDALRYMHHRLETPIIHRDLKSDNCFLYGDSDEEYLNVKVGDFGLATQVGSSGRKTMLGTVGFMAPEIFDEMYDEKVDIYAFGMLMLEVMTNRTPYDECATLFDAAAKTMSGQGPEIMQQITNSNLSVLISACIHPLACFRPTAEELYCHPLFQTNVVKTAASSLQPKTIPVEVEPNYETGADRKEVLERFVRSLANPETRNPRFNLRLRFRDRKMLQELGLDEGESLEFDLDIYKAEDQDIPDLITSLRRDYEDKLSRAFANPKMPDRKMVSNHLDRLFNSIRMQMQFLVKCLLGRRWKEILDSLATKEKPPKEKPVSQENQEIKAEDVTAGSEEEPDSNIAGCSNFEIIAKCKSKWLKAKRMLDREIQAYRKAASLAESGRGALQIGGPAHKLEQQQPQQQQQQTQQQPGNPLVPPQSAGPTGPPSAPVLSAPEVVPHGIASTSPNLLAEAVSAGIEDASAALQASSTPTVFFSPISQQQDYSGVQQGSPTAFVQACTPHPSINPPITSQPQGQAGSARSPAQPVAVQLQPAHPSPGSQHQNPIISPLVAGQVLQVNTQHMPRETPSNLGAAGVHPTIFQIAQTPTAVPFPALPIVTSSIAVGLVEQQPASVTAGFPYVAQQPTSHCSATGLPSNFTLQQPQQQQRMGEERLHEREITSDVDVAGQPGGPGSGLPEALLVPALGFGGATLGYASLPAQHSASQQLTSIASSPVLVAKATEQQRVAPPVGPKPKRKMSQTKPVVSQQPLRYIIRITRLERESEGCDVPGTLRPTFYLEMPDVNNPNSELWKLSFRCNLSDTTDDIKLFEGCGYTQTNGEVDRAIKEAVAVMLRALQLDENSIPLNHDYVFYPQLSPELRSISGCTVPAAAAPTESTNEEAGQLSTMPTAVADPTAPLGTTIFYCGSLHDGELSDTTSSAGSPVEKNLHSVPTGIPGMQATPDYAFSSTNSPYINQVASISSYTGHSGLEEVPPIFTIGQVETAYPSKSVSTFPINVDPLRFYPSEPGNPYDSTESLPIYNNAAYVHSMGPSTKEPDVFTTLKVPAHAQSLVAQFAHHLCTCRRNDPLLIVPSDANTTGYMSVLSENCSFLCSRNGIGAGFSVMPIPISSSFLEVQSKSASTLQGRVIRAPYSGFIVVTPDGEMHHVQRPLIIVPGNSQRPLLELPLLGADGSSVQLDDILTLLINLREGMANTSIPASIPRERSATDTASQPQVRQQDANYYSLPYGAVPMNSTRATMQAPPAPVPSTFTRQMGIRPPLSLMQQMPIRVASGSSSSITHGDLSTTGSATRVPPVSSLEYLLNRPSVQNSRQSQQLCMAPAVGISGLRSDQVAQQTQPNLEYLSTLLSANPSLFLATAAALSVNNSTAPQPTPAGLSNLQAPPVESLWSNPTCASSNSFSPATTSLSSADAMKQILLRAALESVHQQQQQQPIPTPCAATIPTMSAVPTVTMTAPVHPGPIPSTEVFDHNAAHGQPILPTASTTLFQSTRLPQPAVALAQPVMGITGGQTQMFQQQQHSIPVAASLPCSSSEVPQLQPSIAATIIPTSAPPVRPSVPVAPAVSKFVVTPAASVSSLQTTRESITSTSSSTGLPPPPPPLPSPSLQVTTVVGNRFTVVSLDSGAVQPNPIESPHSPMLPPPPPHALAAPAVPLQTVPSGPGVYKKIPPKFTVSSVESDATQCSESILLPHSTSDGTSTLAAPNATDSAPNISLSNTLRSSPPSENDLPSECPPPPSTPAMSNQSFVVEPSLPPTSRTAN